MYEIKLRVNGEDRTALVKADMSLLEVLRDQFHLTAAKCGCNCGDCGACSVIADGKLIKSCITNAMTCDGMVIETLEGLAKGPGRLSILQNAFHQNCASQCGFCTPGMIMASLALLRENPDPSEEEIKEALAGNLCRCTGYVNIIKAVRQAATAMKEAE